MLAQNNDLFEETCETVYKLNQNEEVRYLCEMREEGERIIRTYKSLLQQRDEKLEESNAKLAESNAKLAESTALIAELQAKIKALENK